MSASVAQSGQKLEINLTPLLDLVLQLIMFFMLTVNFVRIDQINDEVVLPVVQSALPIRTSPDSLVYISISKDDFRMASGKRLASTSQLKTYIQDRKRELDGTARLRAERMGVKYQAPTIIVVVRAHRDASWGAIYDTLQECTNAGYSRWQLRVLKQAAPS
jgi:biopolymer transport protein ExbD